MSPTMTLGQLIKSLESIPPETKVRRGIGRPHSNRGYYDQLGFEPVENTTVGEMLTAAKSADGATYQGWKGGDFTMRLSTEVNVSKQGESGSPLVPEMLWFMIPADVKMTCWSCDGTGKQQIECRTCSGSGMAKVVED